MASDHEDVKTWEDGGSPPTDALWIELVVDQKSRENEVGMVRHTGHPWTSTDTFSLKDLAAKPVNRQFTKVAEDYLLWLNGWANNAKSGVNGQDEIPKLAALTDELLRALNSGSNSGSSSFGWIGIEDGSRSTQPRLLGSSGCSSYWLARRDNYKNLIDCSLVLLASRHLHGSATGEDIGLRVVLHFRETCEKGSFQACIYGATFSNLASIDLNRTLDFGSSFGTEPDAREALKEIRTNIEGSLKLQSVVIDSVARPHTGSDKNLRFTGFGSDGRSPRKGSMRHRTWRFVVDINAGLKLHEVVERVECSALASQGQLPESDGKSDGDHLLPLIRRSLVGQRPTRSKNGPTEAEVEELGMPLPREPLRGKTGPRPASGMKGLRDPNDRFTILKPGSGGRHNKRRRTDSLDFAEVALGKKPLDSRSDAAASVYAYQRAAEFFERFDAYGLDPKTYFRHARLPLAVKPRAAMKGAPDGDAVNAEVRPFWPNDTPAGGTGERSDDAVELPQVLVRFGSAAPSHRVKLDVETDGRTSRRAQYMGLAADPRWAWHEFGHVLNFASTGELEFPFAHSAGDALAAIVADPSSHLAWDDEARYFTFPWVFIPRRHDRDPNLGYCWCGQRNRVRLAFDAPLAQHRHGYFQEQLLSTTLFYLYRCLGGDTREESFTPKDGELNRNSDWERRQEASDYCVYLIFRAIGLLGPDGVAPARTVDQFVSALIDADLGTREWNVEAKWPPDQANRKIARTGGRVHKVIRWAFEQQGLYATDDPAESEEGLGKPPPVDVFVADRRRRSSKRSETTQRDPEARGDGGYHPVPLRWGDSESWHAEYGKPAEDSGRHVATAAVVYIGNRGQRVAKDLTAQIWFGEAEAETVNWRAPSSDPQALGLLNPIADGKYDFCELKIPFSNRSGGSVLWVLVNVNCPSDPSNLATAVEPPGDKDKLIELVANDNNIGLFCLKRT